MSDAMNLVWLAAAILVSVLVIVMALRLSRPLAALIGQSLAASSITPSQTLLLARLVMIGLALIASQAILRWPIALVLGGDRSALPIDAGIAAAALACVLVLLVWSYQTARPMVQAVTLRAIDAAIPTTGEALVAEPTRTSAPVVSPPPSAGDAVTVVAPLFARPSVDAPTLVAGHASDATVVARRADERTVDTRRASDATVDTRRASDPTVDTRREMEATVVARRPEDQDTVVAPRPDDPTLRVRDP
jgi:hypothetical protein